MGPKGKKKEDQNGANNWKVEDPLNLNNWRCVVVMAVERSHYDSFVIKEFLEESSNGRRQEVSIIDLDSFVMKILHDFANGELPYKYAFLLNFSSVFQEAVDYINKKTDVPILVLVKVLKALLFYLREESLAKIEKMEAGNPDPIKAMAERPTNFGNVDVRKKEVTKKGDNGLKVRPPSVTKQDTDLLKRGERAKDDQCINDAPINPYFNLYVLLTGFYSPLFPLELIRAGVPLHALLCIDTSLSGVKRDTSFTRNKLQKQSSEVRAQEIQIFWQDFLKTLWDPKVCPYFRDTIFQVYVPQKLTCDKKKLREFIYREISYLMYDLSDLKRQLNNYLDHMQLWNLSEKELGTPEASIVSVNLPNECVTGPNVLQSIIDAICKNHENSQQKLESDSLNSGTDDSELHEKYISPSVMAKYGSSAMGQAKSQELKERGDLNLLNVYFKMKDLDVKYDLDEAARSAMSDLAFDQSGNENSELLCTYQYQGGGENMEEALQSSEGVFRCYWKKYREEKEKTCKIDYSLYALLMTKVFCPYQARSDASPTRSYVTLKKNSDFGLIENLDKEMRKPHFTVTEGSRSILRAVPYNVKNTSRDFFCPKQFKIVSPEKLKASSAPEFRVTPALRVQALFPSQVLFENSEKNPYEKLRGFIDDCVFSHTNDFDFLEFLSKPKLIDVEHARWSDYNCVDHFYSFLNDCILLMLHNRKDSDNFHHETFNEMLRTAVGLRDFYEYVMEDEAKWLANQEELYQSGVILANKMLDSDSFRDFTESDFWLQDSIKYQQLDHSFKESKSWKDTDDVKTEYSSLDKLIKKHKVKTCLEYTLDKMSGILETKFEGYDVSDMTVQFSGLKTVYYSDDCNVTVQLIERLYGEQQLGVHVSAASNTLHLYSYVCPEPHISDPFTFHFTYKNGIIVAFGRRFIEAFEEVEEKIESRTVIKSKRNSSEVSTRVIKKLVPISIKDEEFFYDLGVSLPNGLTIQTVRRAVKPCYIKQRYLVKKDDSSYKENCRLFLPNGNVVRMMSDGTVQILHVDASIVTADLNDLIEDGENGSLCFSKFEHVSGDGYVRVYEQGTVTSSERFQIFKNTDVETNRTFFRRRDGTNYMLDDSGTLCVQFNDGTKMSSSLVLETPSFDGKVHHFDSDSDFSIVYTKITAEHPDYATVTFDTRTQNWIILLPFESAITIEPTGVYSVDINKNTELRVQTDQIEMNIFSDERQRSCKFQADLSIFESNTQGNYCQLKDSEGKVFVVEGNSNCYIAKEEDSESQESRSRDSETSEFVASTDLQVCPSVAPHANSNKLFRENKYFVINRDVTGVELLHVEDAQRELTKIEKGSLIFSQIIPGTGNRCFVLIRPKPKADKRKKWKVDSILANPKHEPSSKRKKTTSSTYGTPPSWIHPFPKRKVKFVVPEPLTCRVFVETKPTEFTPPPGNIDVYNCEIDDIFEVKHSTIPNEGVDDYLKKVSEDDQDILKEMYSLAAASLINGKKKQKPVNSDKLDRYLKMSKHYVELREYHKNCIRYHIVPNFFHHPAGMSWLILNKLIDKLALPRKKLHKNIASPEKVDDGLLSSTAPLESQSFEEIEYNLSLSADQSFSDLSWRSNLSPSTAPEVLETFGVCKCRVKLDRRVASAPGFLCDELLTPPETGSFEVEMEAPESKKCEFQQSDLHMIKLKRRENKRGFPMSLEDLMILGLI